MDPEAYRARIRWRYRNSPAARQQLAVLARHLAGGDARPPLSITGPFAAEARAILTAIHRRPEDLT
ncbi:hypothetical protein CKO23_16560 [Thiocystis violacea]|nr:hypothetical protein [Thiocystis violacea]